jgi:hypothetical protein
VLHLTIYIVIIACAISLDYRLLVVPTKIARSDNIVFPRNGRYQPASRRPRVFLSIPALSRIIPLPPSAGGGHYARKDTVRNVNRYANPHSRASLQPYYTSDSGSSRFIDNVIEESIDLIRIRLRLSLHSDVSNDIVTYCRSITTESPKLRSPGRLRGKLRNVPATFHLNFVQFPTSCGKRLVFFDPPSPRPSLVSSLPGEDQFP